MTDKKIRVLQNFAPNDGNQVVIRHDFLIQKEQAIQNGNNDNRVIRSRSAFKPGNNQNQIFNQQIQFSQFYESSQPYQQTNIDQNRYLFYPNPQQQIQRNINIKFPQQNFPITQNQMTYAAQQNRIIPQNGQFNNSSPQYYQQQIYKKQIILKQNDIDTNQMGKNASQETNNYQGNQFNDTFSQQKTQKNSRIKMISQPNPTPIHINQIPQDVFNEQKGKQNNNYFPIKISNNQKQKQQYQENQQQNQLYQIQQSPNNSQRQEFNQLTASQTSKQSFENEKTTNQEEIFNTVLSTQIANCFKCQQELKSDSISLKCQHLYHVPCFMELVKSQVQAKDFSSNILCICHQKINLQLLRGQNQQPLLEKFYKKQLGILKFKNPHLYITCEKCQFFFIHNNEILRPCVNCQQSQENKQQSYFKK